MKGSALVVQLVVHSSRLNAPCTYPTSTPIQLWVCMCVWGRGGVKVRNEQHDLTYLEMGMMLGSAGPILWMMNANFSLLTPTLSITCTHTRGSGLHDSGLAWIVAHCSETVPCDQNTAVVIKEDQHTEHHTHHTRTVEEIYTHMWRTEL